MSPPDLQRSVRWRAASGIGLEHLTLTLDEQGARARSVVVGARSGRSYGAFYELVCGTDWHVLRLDLETTDGRVVALRSNGQGRWTDGSGTPLAEFDGCLDLDLAGTPFTNTLPIRRRDWVENAPVELAVLYIPFDNFEPVLDRQRYICLKAKRLFRYEAADRSFVADLPIDEDGLVIDYPQLFERVM
jgi:hypothetical protein